MLNIYKASAGSGKTYTLAYEYIKILLGKAFEKDGRRCYRLNIGPDAIQRPHARILAITFTNKATAEMKSRILKELDDLTKITKDGEKDAEYAERLMKEYGCTREDLRDVATTALRSLLNDYGAFNVSTIDSFVQSVLRNFAREIDRQGDFRLEMDGEMALSQAISLLFDEINANPTETNEIFNWLEEESSAQMMDGRDFNPFNKRGSMYRKLIGQLKGIFNERFAEKEKEMREYLSDPSRLVKFGEWLDAAIGELKAKEKKATDDLVALNLPLAKYPLALLKKIVDASYVDTTIYSPIKENKSYIQAMRDGDAKGIFGSKSKFEPSETDLAAVSNLIVTLEQCFPLRYVYESIRKRFTTLWAIYYIYNYIERYRQENNLILISDANTMLKRIIDGSETPFIYEKVGMFLENYLIDEFQDTSRMQWENLKPLVTNMVDDADSLIIGDEKQSIYRFRGGDPNLLANKVADYFSTRHKYKVLGEEPGENTNYRSAHDIVLFNNSLFYNLAYKESDVPPPGYKGVAQQLAPRMAEVPAWIRINDLRDEQFSATAPSLLSPEVIDKMVEADIFDAREVALKSMCETILGELERGYSQSDIAILCREREDCSEVADYILREYGEPADGRPAIKLVSEDSLLLNNNSAVKLIVSILEIIDRSLETPDDGKDSLTEAISSTTLYNSEKERTNTLDKYKTRRKRAALIDTFEYYQSHGYDFNSALNHAIEVAEKVERGEKTDIAISSDLAKIRDIAPANLAALVQAIIMLKIPESERVQHMPYLAAFVDLVDEFMQENTATVHSFLAYWNDKKNKANILPGEKEDAVTIMTVHKAKGLEWDCVHLPLLDWKYKTSPRSSWFSTSEIKCDEGTVAPPIIYLNTNDLFGATDSPLKEQYDLECEEERVDNLNVAYVAFTRAARELHVNVVTRPKRKETIGDVILEALKNSKIPEGADTAIYMNLSAHITDGSFTFGAPTFPRKKSNEKVPSGKRPSFHISFDTLGSQITHISEFLNSDLRAEGDIDDNPRKEVDPDSPATRDGNIMHSILSEMRTFDDIDEAVDGHWEQATPEELARYKKIIVSAYEKGDERVKRWFADDNVRVLNEQPILSRVADSTSRADRIVWYSDGTVEVIDYKFTADTSFEHYEQVRGYGVALQMMGYKVRASLWYPLINKVIEVEEFKK